MTQPSTLKCPNCGAPAALDAPACGHCGSHLSTAACPSCFQAIFRGSRFCPRCGAAATRESVQGPAGDCPRCRKEMAHVRVGETPIRECAACGGVWVGTDAFARLSREREDQAVVLGTATARPALDGVPEVQVRYDPCPDCGKLMNRMNFARVSGVIVDECKQHGLWFDRNELRAIVEFLQGGGMDLARERERERLEEERWRAEQARRELERATGGVLPAASPPAEIGAEVALRGLVRFLALWI